LPEVKQSPAFYLLYFALLQRGICARVLIKGRSIMKIAKLLALGVIATAGYYLYRCFASSRCDFNSQWDEVPDPAVAKNPIDEASWESFPASDPPSFNVSRSATG
jgi:hypothetical protein